MEGDADLLRVVEVEHRASLTEGEWGAISFSNVSGFFGQTVSAGQGFYRLRTSSLPFALSGPVGESVTQGVRLETPGSGDLLFFNSVADLSGSTLSLGIWLDDALRGTVHYAPARAGETFRYVPSGESFATEGTFTGDETRLYSPAFLKARATSAAGEGAGVARSFVTDLIGRYPDSVTVWQNVGGDFTNEATVLYVRAQAADPNQGARPGQFGGDVHFLAQPLISGGVLTDLSNVAVAWPYSPTDAGQIDLNSTNSTHPQPLIGRRTSASLSAPVTAAQWIYLGSNNSPTNATNPAVARYAFWVEDESFKVNVNVATNGPRGTNSLGLGPAEIRMDGALQTSTNPVVAGADAAAVVSTRGLLGAGGFASVESAAAASGITDSEGLSEFRFLSTVNSAGLDLSRGGFKRFNINSVTNGDKRAALDRITAAITNSNAAPLFGQRFYRLTNSISGINDTAAVTPHHSGIYLQKIAANIFDYLDDDDQPTVINNDASFTLRIGRPTEPILAIGGGLDGSNSVAAFGVENFPRLQEWAMHARLWRMYHGTNANSLSNFGFVFNSTNPAANPTQANYEIWLDYYFEFYNPGTRDIVVTNAFITLGGLPAFRGVQTNDALYNERSITNIPLNATFPAGRITILTTAALGEDSFSSISSGGVLTNRANVVYLPVSTNDRKFTGVTTSITNVAYDATGDSLPPPIPNFNRLFQVTMVPGPQTKGSLLIGNGSGILESFVGLPFNAQANPSASGLVLRVGSGFIRNSLMSLPDGNNDFVRGACLRANNNDASSRPSATEGDPRALLEQLEFLNFTPISTDADLTRFYMTVTGSGGLPENSTFGSLNTNLVRATNWTDATPWQLNSSNAPLFVRNAAMQSIGELGHITDPARAPGSSGNVARARGGGRTLRIGQSELSETNSPWRLAWYDGSQTNASRTWTSWRLTDIFTTMSSTNARVRGLINPNGALRDDGAALRAALFGLAFQPAPDGSPNIAGRSASVSNVVSNVVGRLKEGDKAGLGVGTLNPFWERGEISELEILNSTSGTLASGAVMSNAFDRGREELVRRSIEMITTRGSVFTAYVIGQAVQVTPTGTNVLSETRLRSTFEIGPQFEFAADDAFDPASAAEMERRFLPPTNYTSQVVSEWVD